MKYTMINKCVMNRIDEKSKLVQKSIQGMIIENWIKRILIESVYKDLKFSL